MATKGRKAKTSATKAKVATASKEVTLDDLKVPRLNAILFEFFEFLQMVDSG